MRVGYIVDELYLWREQRCYNAFVIGGGCWVLYHGDYRALHFIDEKIGSKKAQ